MIASSILSRPEVIASSVLIVGATIVALRMTRPGAKGLPRLNFRRNKTSAVPAAGGGGETPFQVGKADDIRSTHQAVTFADVAGLDEAIAELREVTEYLSDPYRFQSLGAELPRGILLYGLPGCGKTLLARALAGETGVPFYFVSATSFVEKFVGLGAARVRQLFEAAKRDAPCIIFIDELDAIGRARAADITGDREFDHTLNQLLVELDGFSGASGVLILAATNRPELIDPALLRPGRFDRRIQVDRPDRDGREKILMLHASRRPISRQVDWGEVAANTAGLTAAELASIVNEACLLAARRHRDRVVLADVDEACSRVISGTKSSRLMSDEEKQLVAVHEAGHALLSVLLRGVKPPARVSIVSRVGAFERSPWSSADDREVVTKRELMAQLIVLLGGRAAEMNVFGQPSTRSEDDLEHAAALARRMVERLAMTGRFELADQVHDPKRPPTDENGGGKEVRDLLSKAEQAARSILGDNSDDLQRIADELVEQETLTAAELQDLTRRAGRSEADERSSPLGVQAN
ncbi:MAG TPA: AAA family ATPase [Acidimicrobiales bacterium]|nr:AAA family ATPase [Acidimicrobiales bacterium]